MLPGTREKSLSEDLCETSCEIIGNISYAYFPQFLAQLSKNSYNFLSDESTRHIFCCNGWSLTLVSDVEFLNPLEFPMWVSCFKSDTTLGGLLDGYRMGAGPRKDQVMIRSLKLSAPHPSPGKRRGSRNWINNWLCLCNHKVQRVWWTHLCIRRVVPPNSTGYCIQFSL